jgi:hypothetical protein
MKSIQNQYRDLQEGKMTQSNFMRNVRMTLPQYVTNVTSFKDTVKILKNKGILSESMGGTGIGSETQYDWKGKKLEIDPQSASKVGDIAKLYDEEQNEYVGEVTSIGRNNMIQVDPNSIEADGNNSVLREAIIVSKTNGEDEGWDDAYEKTFDTFNPNEENSDEEFDALIKKIEDEMTGEEAVKSQYDETLKEAKEAMPKGSSGKELYDEFAEGTQLNFQEIVAGIAIEHQETPDVSYEKITKLVYKNLQKDPNYYTNWKLSGVKGYEPKYMDNVNPDEYRMKFLEKDNLIDKPNVMKPVKGFEKAKADANKAKAETNTTVKGVEELSVVAKSVRGVQKMDATGTKVKKIVMKENNGGYGDESPEEYADMLAQAKEFMRMNKKPQPIPTSNQGYGDESPEEYADMQKRVKGLTKNDIIRMVREIMAESGVDGGDNMIDDQQTSMY